MRESRCAPDTIFDCGFSLVEVVIALGITAFCLVAVFGLLPIGLNVNRDSVQQTEAANLVSLIDGDLRSAPKGTNAKSPNHQIAIPDHPTAAPVTLPPIFLNEAAAALPSAAGAKYRFTLTFGAASGRNATPISILVTWPAEAGANTAAGRFSIISTLDRN